MRTTSPTPFRWRQRLSAASRTLLRDGVGILCLSSTGLAAEEPKAVAQPLPLPAAVMPDNPRLEPLVITAQGQRLLLADTDVTVRWHAAEQRLVVSHPGWWVINYPWDRIHGLSAEEAADTILGARADHVRNWYVRTPGQPAGEPAAPTGPAPITLSTPTLIVDQQHPAADDANDGSETLPLRTISAAVARAQPGSVIQVRYGIYRETITSAMAGTRELPITMEGRRDAEGRLPVISANSPAPAAAWTPVAEHPGVWRARAWTSRPAPLARDGRLLQERTSIGELEVDEYCQNRGDPELAQPRLDGAVRAKTGDQALGSTWRTITADDEGWIDLGDERGLTYATTWAWIPPQVKEGEVWDPDMPRPLTGNVTIAGGFRASRQSATAFASQLNPYRLWLNGDLMPGYSGIRQARATTDYKIDGDAWQRLPFREGWNQIVMLLDSQPTKRANRFRFHIPRGRSDMVTQSQQPTDLTQGPPADAPVESHLRHWLLLGTLPSEPERAIYLRTDRDPNTGDYDLGDRDAALNVTHGWWRVRGLHFRHGVQYQQRALVTIGGEGSLLEHCVIEQPEVRGLTIANTKQALRDAPIMVRGNWIIEPGSIGIGAASPHSRGITPENINDDPPGRGRMVIEHNTIIGNNRGGYDRWWESGAMKLFRLTGSVIRYNTIIEGDGPGIWLDWEHYQNRIEGNLGLQPTGFLVGVEASPGPHLIANNVAIGTRSGGAWFCYAFLAWSSGRIWSVHNTVDGQTDGKQWHRGYGLYFGEGPDDRKTCWGAITDRHAAVVNNLVFGCGTTINRGRSAPVLGNLFYSASDRWGGMLGQWMNADIAAAVEAGQVRPTDAPPTFPGQHHGSYRPAPSSLPASGGVAQAVITADDQPLDLISLVRHDFFGLLRFPEDGTPVGAFRNEPAPPSGTVTELEIEWTDGRIERRHLQP